MKYKQHRKLITLNCDCCGCSYEKPLSEYNRNQKFGRHSFCSRSCAMKFNSMHPTQKMIDYSNSEKNKEHLRKLNPTLHLNDIKNVLSLFMI